ncbi:TadE/TadG family type IV pilus assembly protein [Acidithiobacillus thiooxidans]|uniref:TadE/TadG family type IV pilus assembly protein n=1 Tax=Acidithiobacillus thiooxidans TaxID=930 RepID=UPI00356AB531
MDFMVGLPRADARGQATVFAVILLLAVVVGIGVLYNTGRLTLDKTRLQNTADSAAYSSGVLLARSYNFSAYANRAMVANQVVIAQMVGLRSWSNYYCLDYHDSCKDDNANSPSDLPGQIGPMVKQVIPYDVLWPLYQGISEANLIPNAVDVAIATAANGINKILSLASSTYQDAVLADLAAATTQAGLVHTIIKANYPHLASGDRPYLGTIGQGLWLTDLAQAKAYTQLYGSNNPQHMQMFATVVKDSLDKWTRERISSGGLSTSESPPYPMYNALGFIQGLLDCRQTSWIHFAVSYHGHTQWQWQGSNPHWSAQDRANIYGYNLFFFPNLDPFDPWPPCLPFGPIPVDTSPTIYPFSAQLLSKARAEYGQQTSHGGFKTGYAGLEPYGDVSQQNLSTTHAPVLSLDLVRKHNTIATTQQLHVDQGKSKVGIGATNRLNLLSKEAHGEMAALASVQVHFVRPGGAGHQRLLGSDIEYGTLFNPYWEAHLVPTPSTTQSAVQIGQEKR